tara:strand:- start:267 stop:401 length:135 start_codon:yes stop_codon:yes gene_type:complete
MEKRKYNPPTHWDVDLQIRMLGSRYFTLSKIVNPVEVNPETASK